MEIGGERFRQLDLDHPEIEVKILAEMSAGVAVYYDRHWPFTREYCHFLLRHPDLVAGRKVMVVGAGVGMEAVVAGRLADRIWINDRAPVALELQERQLHENRVTGIGLVPGSFADLDLPPEVDLVMGCFIVYDAETAGAVESMLARNHSRGVPTLLADLDLGRHFSRVLSRLEGPVRWIVPPGAGLEGASTIQVALVG